MEIWNGRQRLACVFRYNVADCRPTLTWCGGWKLDLETRVIRIWKDVARAYNHVTLGVDACILQMDSIMSHGDAVCHLQLIRRVLHRVSLRQIRLEARNRSCIDKLMWALLLPL